MTNVLVIDDEVDIVNNIKSILKDEFYNVDTATNSDEAIKIFEEKIFDLVILDVWLDDSKLDGLELLKIFREKNNNPIIVISGHGTIDMAVKAIKDGASEFIEKPFNTERLLISVRRSIELNEVKSENNELKKSQMYDYQFIGNSIAMLKIKNSIKKIGPTLSRVMIYGDSGTGKDIVAREIHRTSNNSDGPFVIINAALMEPETVEKELFGFKNQNDNKPGYLENASNGTLFIDEVGEMPLQTQAKILRALTDKYFSKVGSDDLIELNCRIICSSTKDLNRLVGDGSFRKDLFHRLNVVTIIMPNLIDRQEDIDHLIEYFTTKYCKQYRADLINLKPLIKSKYINYNWPGNVRELRNIIERHVILGEKYDDSTMNETKKDISNKNVISLPLKNARKVFEKNYLLSQINRFNGNISKTAEFIGMERSALHRKLKQLGITEEDK